MGRARAPLDRPAVAGPVALLRGLPSGRVPGRGRALGAQHRAGLRRAGRLHAAPRHLHRAHADLGGGGVRRLRAEHRHAHPELRLSAVRADDRDPAGGRPPASLQPQPAGAAAAVPAVGQPARLGAAGRPDRGHLLPVGGGAQPAPGAAAHAGGVPGARGLHAAGAAHDALRADDRRLLPLGARQPGADRPRRRVAPGHVRRAQHAVRDRAAGGDRPARASATGADSARRCSWSA